MYMLYPAVPSLPKMVAAKDTDDTLPMDVSENVFDMAMPVADDDDGEVSDSHPEHGAKDGQDDGIKETKVWFCEDLIIRYSSYITHIPLK